MVNTLKTTSSNKKRSYNIKTCPRCLYNNANGDCTREDETCYFFPRFKVDLINLIKEMGTNYSDGQLWGMGMDRLERIYKRGIISGKKANN